MPRLKCEKKEEEGYVLQKLRNFAFRENFPYLVGLCNVLLDPISRETGITYTDSTTISITGDSTFQSDLNALVGNTLFSDVEFVVKNVDDGEKEDDCTNASVIPVHKTILASRSDYFKAMFDPTKQLRESQSRTVHIDLHKNILSGILSYLYAWINPKKSLNAQYVISLLEASTRMMISHLVMLCQIFLIENLDRSNVCLLFSLADTFHANFLREECIDFIRRNYVEMKKHDELSQLDPALTIEIQRLFQENYYYN